MGPRVCVARASCRHQAGSFCENAVIDMVEERSYEVAAPKTSRPAVETPDSVARALRTQQAMFLTLDEKVRAG